MVEVRQWMEDRNLRYSNTRELFAYLTVLLSKRPDKVPASLLIYAVENQRFWPGIPGTH